MAQDNRLQRRRFLKASGVAGVTGLAGCIGGIGGGGGGPIPVGSILPITGALSAYGSGMQAAVEGAVKTINDNGGVLGGRELDLTTKDSATKPAQAVQRYNTLVSETGVVGFVGAASSGVSVSIAENVSDDEVMQVSNASTSPALAEMGYKEIDGKRTKFFGRTSPNDGQQGLVMGLIMNKKKYIDADSASFLFVNNAYGQGLADKAAEAFDGEVLNKVGYDKKTQDYSSTLDKVHDGEPDAVGFVGYPGNGQTILKQWSEGGYGTSAEDWVLSEGLNSKEFLTSNKNIVAGMYLASPDPESTKKGQSHYEDVTGQGAGTLFAPHAYDAMFLQALAMERADEASGVGIAQNIRAVSRPDGQKVFANQWKKARDLVADGEAIDYQGVSSPVNLNKSLEPLNRFAVLRVKDDGSRENLEKIPRSFFEGKL